MVSFFPRYKNLGGELDNLFCDINMYEEIMDDFRRNGQDSEYCPDSDSELLTGCFRGPGSRTRPRNGVHGLGLRRGGIVNGGPLLSPTPPASAAGMVLRGGPPQPPPPPQPQHVSSAAYAAIALSLLPTASLSLKLCCAFCRKNGETLAFYSGHMLKDSKGRVTCPILRAYTCPYCGANGDKAHTVKYCPVNIAAEATMVAALTRESPIRVTGRRAASDCSVSTMSTDAGRRRRHRRSH